MNIGRRYGLIAGLLVSNFSFYYFTNTNSASLNQVAPALAAILALLYVITIVYGIRQRKQFLADLLPVKEGIRTGLAMSILASLIVGVATYISIVYIDNSGFLTKAAEASRASLEKDIALTPEEVEAKVAQAIRFGPIILGWLISSVVLLLGGITTMVSANVLKTR